MTKPRKDQPVELPASFPTKPTIHDIIEWLIQLRDNGLRAYELLSTAPVLVGLICGLRSGRKITLDDAKVAEGVIRDVIDEKFSGGSGDVEAETIRILFALAGGYGMMPLQYRRAHAATCLSQILRPGQKPILAETFKRHHEHDLIISLASELWCRIKCNYATWVHHP